MSSRPAVRFLDRTTPPHILTLVLMSGLAAMSMSAFLPSLPAMTAYFDTEYGIMQLSVSLYLAGTAVLQLMIGPISDRYGRRSLTLISIGVFVVASVGCLLAPTVEVFLFFRMMQGAVAVGFVLSRAIVRDMVPQDEAASMIGYVTMGMALVPMVAPMIGGALDQWLGWQSVFAFLALSGLGVLLLCFFDQGETASEGGIGFAEQFSQYPELLTSYRFWGYSLTAAFASGSFFAFLGGGALVATEVFGLNSFWTGVAFGAPAIGYAIGNGMSGRFSGRVGINRMVLIGAFVNALGLGLASMLVAFGYDSALLFFGFCTFVGLGNGMVIPNATAGLLSVRPHLAGTASGLGSAIMIAGGAGLSVFAGVVLTWGAGSLPLLMLMAASALLGLLSILFVLQRERNLARI